MRKIESINELDFWFWKFVYSQTCIEKFCPRSILSPNQIWMLWIFRLKIEIAMETFPEECRLHSIQIALTRSLNQELLLPNCVMMLHEISLNHFWGCHYHERKQNGRFWNNLRWAVWDVSLAYIYICTGNHELLQNNLNHKLGRQT